MIAKFGKRSISFLLAVAMLFSMVPVQAFATEDHEEETQGIILGFFI